ncbi:unnamed protein product [Sphagnum compactum]
MVEEKRRGAWGAGKSGQPCRPPWRSLSEGRLAAPLTTPVPHPPSPAARLPQATARFLLGRKILPIPFVSTPIVFSCQQGGRVSPLQQLSQQARLAMGADLLPYPT